MIYKNILENLGSTPLINVKTKELANIHLFVKLEFLNPTGSVKDRAASYIIGKLISKKKINKDTLVVESSSGNFGISLAAYCKLHGLKFCCVVDPHISPINEFLIENLGATLVKVTKPDKTGGYLLNRIKKVKSILKNNQNSFWINQYANPCNAEAYYKTLGKEICDEFNRIDYVFIGVSSGGTITGVSNQIKKKFPDAKIIAVDIVGSKIFGDKPQKRYIPGIGSSMVPKIIEKAKIDEVIIVDEVSTINMCRELLREHCIFAGGSSGSVFAAIKKYFKKKEFSKKPIVITIFPDKGDRYFNTVYNDKWRDNFINNYKKKKSLK